MRSSKLGTLFIVAILALAGLGVVYAGWTDLITVSGTVQTGKVEFSIDEYSGTWVWKHHEDPDGNQLHDKVVHIGPVADTDINGDGKYNDDPHADAVYYYAHPEEWKLISYSYAYEKVTDEEVGFDFVNLYPCIWFYVDFEFTINSIPVILNEAEFTWDSMVPTDWIYDAQGDFGWHILDESGNVIYDPSMGALGVDTVLVQLHPGKTYIWELWIHVAQKNEYQKATASGSGSIGVIQWSDPCDGTTTDDKTITIPTGPFTMKVYGAYPSGWPSYFKTVLTNLPAGTYSPPIAEGAQCLGWCVDNTPPGQYITPGVAYHTYMYDSYNLPTSLPGGYAAQPWMTDTDWPYVNWIINNKGSATPQQIQAAIWYFVDGGYTGSNSNVWALINGALNNPDGINYVPPAGQTPPSVVAAICWVDPTYQCQGQHQTTIIEVDP